MGLIQLVVAIPVALVLVALIHDFIAGLGEERLWSDPYLEDPESFRNRAAAARGLTTTVTSVEVKPAASPKLGSYAGARG